MDKHSTGGVGDKVSLTSLPIVAARLLELKGEKSPHEPVEKVLSSGAAYEKLERFVHAQGGGSAALENLPTSRTIREVQAPRGGYVAGRKKKIDKIDPAAGVELLEKPGDRVERGDPIARLHGDREAEQAERLILEALEISDEPPGPTPAILDDL